MTTCKLCGADIIFVRTRLGARMPLDAEPSPDGTVELVDDPDGTVAVVIGAPTLFDHDDTRYVPHWATCTGDVDKVRRKR